MCQALEIDRKDLMLLFYNIKNNCINNSLTNSNIYNSRNTKIIDYLIDKYDISILDINRLVKFVSAISSYGVS